MGHRKACFRITKRGKITLTILLTSLLLIIVITLQRNYGLILSRTSNLKNTGPGITENNKQLEDKTADRVSFDNNEPANTARHSTPDKVDKTVDNTSGKDNAYNSSEIDEKFFSNALFIGDSITEGISSYGFLDKKNVLAVKGCTISKAEKELDTIVKRKPDKIYILLGSNDLLYGMDSRKFTSEYIELINHIKDKLPVAKIYIQSIFPVSKDIEVKKPMLSNSRIDEFNRVLKSTTEEQSIGYINAAALLKDDSGIMNKEYTSDGIHIKYNVYSIWLDYVKKNS